MCRTAIGIRSNADACFLFAFARLCRHGLLGHIAQFSLCSSKREQSSAKRALGAVGAKDGRQFRLSIEFAAVAKRHLAWDLSMFISDDFFADCLYDAQRSNACFWELLAQHFSGHSLGVTSDSCDAKMCVDSAAYTHLRADFSRTLTGTRFRDPSFG